MLLIWYILVQIIPEAPPAYISYSGSYFINCSWCEFIIRILRMGVENNLLPWCRHIMSIWLDTGRGIGAETWFGQCLTLCILRIAVKVKAMVKNRGMPSMICPAFSTVVILASFVFRPTSTPATYAVAPSSSSVTCTAIFAAFIWRSVGMCVPYARMPLAIIMISRGICFVCTRNMWIRGRDKRRADSRFVPSQWETALHCNDVSHWLGASLESAL